MKHTILATDCRADWKRKRSHWGRDIKSRVGRHVKKLLQSQRENDEGQNYRRSNGIRENRTNWTDNSEVNNAKRQDKENQKSQRFPADNN